MIIDQILNDKISKLKKINILNNFPEDLQNNLVNKIVEILKEEYKNQIEIHRIYDDVNIKKLSDYINNFDLFSQTIALFLYNFTQNLSSLVKLSIPSDLLLFVFTDEKKIEDTKDISVIQFPKNLDPHKYINDFCINNKIKFDNNNTEDLFKSYFNSFSGTLEKVLDDILIFLQKTKSQVITKEIVAKFLTFSSGFTIYNITNAFFQKDKYSFFYQYLQFVESENDFNSFLQPFLKEVKLLTILASLTMGKGSITESDKNNIFNFFNKLNLQYNPYRLQYDLKKLDNFGKKRFYSLLEFLISIDIYSRYYDKSSAQKLFEIGINQFI